MPPIEQWKTIATHTGYEVSNRGRIRNKKTGHILSNTRTGNGYLKVNLGTGPKCTKRVNRLVAFAFWEIHQQGKFIATTSTTIQQTTGLRICNG